MYWNQTFTKIGNFLNPFKNLIYRSPDIGHGSIPVTGDHLLKEDGFALLKEDGGFILLERYNG